jgi:ABC-type sugar transport system substrate-binding protein
MMSPIRKKSCISSVLDKPVRAPGVSAFRRPIIACLATLLVCVHACDRPGGAGSARSRNRVRVAVVGVAEDDSLWPVLRNGALRAERDFGVVTIETFCPAVPSAEAQSDLLRDLRGREFLAVCVQVAEPEAIRPALEDLRSAGAFVVTLVRPVPSSPPFHHCGLDEAEVGRAMADALLESIDHSGTIAVLANDRSEGAADTRSRVFQDRIREHPEVHLLRELSDAGTPAEAWATTQAFCARYPRLNALVLLSDRLFEDTGSWPTALAPRPCKVFGVGAVPARWPLLAKCWCHALVGARYDEIGYKAVQWCIVVAHKGELPPQAHGVPLHVVWCSGLDAWKARWARWTEPMMADEP